ncbi:YkuJ [Listeria marthii FSL S4-120]|uniref:YkuJ n=2 Tax=Listeria TaxID=1637 RepID=A0ABN0BYI5_9LIST|nr:YkuJ [Listeria marthii FSL S4-120]
MAKKPTMRKYVKKHCHACTTARYANICTSDGGFERRGKMSQLLGIIQRLHAMQEDESAETQARRFEKNGTPVCEVKFFQASNSFEVEIYGDNSKYQFDDIDMTAIEIFETLQENE